MGWLVLLLAFAAFGVSSIPTHAQNYPNRSISVVVPFPAGGPSDVVARIVTEHMSRTLGQQMVIENVVGAPLVNPVVLCGSMFGLRVYRHRLFECDPPIYFPPFGCNHSFAMPASKGAYHVLDDDHPFITAVGHNFAAESGRRAMLIDWMTRDEMAQAIPPAYTEWIGAQLMAALRAAA
jgi:hypothetical protein